MCVRASVPDELGKLQTSARVFMRPDVSGVKRANVRYAISVSGFLGILVVAEESIYETPLCVCGFYVGCCQRVHNRRWPLERLFADFDGSFFFVKANRK